MGFVYFWGFFEFWLGLEGYDDGDEGWLLGF